MFFFLEIPNDFYIDHDTDFLFKSIDEVMVRLETETFSCQEETYKSLENESLKNE